MWPYSSGQWKQSLLVAVRTELRFQLVLVFGQSQSPWRVHTAPRMLTSPVPPRPGAAVAECFTPPNLRASGSCCSHRVRVHTMPKFRRKCVSVPWTEGLDPFHLQGETVVLPDGWRRTVRRSCKCIGALLSCSF